VADFARSPCRIYIPEILVSLYFLLCASDDYVLGAGHYYINISLQAFTFFLLGLGFVGTALNPVILVHSGVSLTFPDRFVSPATH
jgi:hypothetical protein